MIQKPNVTADKIRDFKRAEMEERWERMRSQNRPLRYGFYKPPVQPVKPIEPEPKQPKQVKESKAKTTKKRPSTVERRNEAIAKFRTALDAYRNSSEYLNKRQFLRRAEISIAWLDKPRNWRLRDEFLAVQSTKTPSPQRYAGTIQSRVLELLRKSQPLTNAEIAQRLGLTVEQARGAVLVLTAQERVLETKTGRNEYRYSMILEGQGND